MIIVIAGIAGFATAAALSHAAVTEESRKAPAVPHEVQAMDRSEFWAIIGRTTALEAHSEDQALALRHELDRLTPDQIASFEATFDEIMRQSYSWDLWGADFVIHGGASDDAFEYFRVWLISKGQRVFEGVSKDPDSLADLLASDSSGPLEFEDFAYVARTAWEAKTGKDLAEMPRVADMIYPGSEPSGEPLKEDEEHLAKRYPKLWKRFGHNPVH